MAGRGPAPKDPGTRQRGNSTSTKAKLSVVRPEDIEIPPMPNADEYIADPFGQKAQWNPAVVRWWNDIWSSPMSAEFSDSDIHGLYLGCMYFHEQLNPLAKPTARASFATKFEQVVRNYGLNPMARRSLQWEIDRGDEAATRTDKRRQAQSQLTPKVPASDPRKNLA